MKIIMSDNNTNVLRIELPQVVTEAIKPLATSIGNTLSNIWNGAFAFVSTWSQKKQLESKHNVELFKEELQSKMELIPEDNLQEPKMNILGPSLEASKSYFEEDWYRQMFSKLIAASCDKSKNITIHPCFVEIVKQLSLIDASILKRFKTNDVLPICNIILVNKEGSNQLFANLIYNSDHHLFYQIAASLENLQRLGLIQIKYDEWIIGDNYYSTFEQTPLFIGFKRQYELSNIEYPKVSIEKGLTRLTPLGKNFFNICV